jgi:hypothetical protein
MAKRNQELRRYSKEENDRIIGSAAAARILGMSPSELAASDYEQRIRHHFTDSQHWRAWKSDVLRFKDVTKA